ncbi:HNH endonuclease [Salinibacter sp.]|uniref:HNH endonuclease n=1 Tax=Salinibacter sp. TaxID=2065818 RepID=UPI0021E8584A|nr:HNH endonuclease [Salinibacter sp.]
MPNCKQPLIEDETRTDDPSVIGEEAHIVARKQDGPRGNSELTSEERDRFDNLILLCRNHHKTIDDQVEKYTVKRLKSIKKKHFAWVDENLDVDKGKQEDDLTYSAYIDEWAQRARIDSWEEWTSSILSHGQPSIRVERFESLETLNQYILNRFWPGRYSDLESSLKNFRLVLNDFLPVMREHAEKIGEENEWYETAKFYKRGGFNSNYDSDLSKYNYHVDLVQDLMLELTRAGNRVCREVRKSISSRFRSKEGVLLLQSGPHMDFSFRTFRVEYQSDDVSYPGLREFMDVRKERDRYYGKGVSDDYFPKWGLD